MKNNILKIIVGTFIFMNVVTSCNKDDASAVPTVNLSDLNFTYEPGEGEILIKWNKPEEGSMSYMMMSYTDPKDNKSYTKSISVYTSEYLIKDTRARYGDAYSFTFTPYSEDGTPGTPFTLDKCKSNPAPSIVTVSYEKITPLKIITNAQEESTIPAGRGLLEHLTDGNPTTFFHSTWNKGNKPPHHWIDIDLGEEVDRIEIRTINHSGNFNPLNVKLYRLSMLEDVSVDYESYIYSYKHPSQDKGIECKVMYPAQEEDAMSEPLRYLRYCASSSSEVYWHLAEMELYKVIVSVYNPETDEL